MVKPEHNPREKLLSAGPSSTRNQNETLSTVSSLSLSLSLCRRDEGEKGRGHVKQGRRFSMFHDLFGLKANPSK
jgi:hypothetical protein